MRHNSRSGDLRVRKPARQLLGGRLPVQRQGESLDVVVALPVRQRFSGGLEVQEALPAPELLVVDPVTPLDFAVLLGRRGLI